jgi:DNA-binding MarR family transcriptional regulator
MVRKSNYSKNEYYQAIGQAVQAYQDSTTAFDDAGAEHLGLNRTDLACLGVIYAQTSVSAGDIAKATHLTKGAMTTALDRIEKAGYAKRIRDAEDRRGVRVELTKKGRESVDMLWGHFAKAGVDLLSQFDTKELDAILRFLIEAKAMQDEHRDRISKKQGK